MGSHLLAFDTRIPSARHDPNSCLAHGLVYITKLRTVASLLTVRFRHPPAGAKVGMSPRTRVPQSESQSQLRIRPAAGKGPTLDSDPPITRERLAKLGVESRLIHFIASATSQADRSSNGLSSLGPTHAKTLVENLDKVRDLRKFSPAR